jgi:phosphotransferase system  glucose/maltose/N-acetylglucosamine-specific IIC component
MELEVYMDKAWTKIITVTGAVGVIGLLFSLLMNHFFNIEIANLLGSEKLFYIIVMIICVFAVAIVLAILKPKDSGVSSSSNPSSKEIKITYDNESTHNGDNNF